MLRAAMMGPSPYLANGKRGDIGKTWVGQEKDWENREEGTTKCGKQLQFSHRLVEKSQNMVAKAAYHKIIKPQNDDGER